MENSQELKQNRKGVFFAVVVPIGLAQRMISVVDSGHFASKSDLAREALRSFIDDFEKQQAKNNARI